MENDWADEIVEKCRWMQGSIGALEMARQLRAAELRGRVAGMREAVSVAFNCAHDYAMAVDGGESRNSKNIDHALGANKAAQLIHAAATKLESSPTT